MTHRIFLLCAIACAFAFGTVSTSFADDSLTPPVQLKGEDFITKDGVKLYGTYYPSTLGKEAVPVMLIQDLSEDRKSLQPLAEALQAQGCAVVTLDVRGQGDSIKATTGKGKTTKDVSLEKLRMTPKVLEAMVLTDIDTFKKFLNRENNDGKLNVSKLCIVGVGASGCYLATAYAAYDCSWGAQGSDVKVLALVSPRVRNGIMNFPKAIKPALKDVVVYQWHGSGDAATARDAKVLAGMFKQQHPGEDKLEAKEKTFFDVAINTRLQGLKLITGEDNTVEKHLLKLIEIKLQKIDTPYWSMKE